MALRHAFKRLGKSLLEEGVSALKTLEDAKMSDIKAKVDVALRHALKRLALFLIFTTGVLFLLFGLGRYLQETVPGFEHGIAYIFIGGGLLLVGFVGKLFLSDP
jgi:hypothetical protein